MSESLKEPGQTAFEAYWETPSACWDDMSDLGKAKWAQAERKIIASAEAAAHAKGRAEGIGEAVKLLESQFSAPGVVRALRALLPTTGGSDDQR